jgi:hypothetical protein
MASPSAQQRAAAVHMFHTDDQRIRLNPGEMPDPAFIESDAQMMRGNKAIVNEMEF